MIILAKAIYRFNAIPIKLPMALFADVEQKNLVFFVLHIQWRIDSLFNNWCWENWTATCKRMKLEHSLTPCTKINSKWIKDLKVRPDTIKLLEENIGRTVFNINHSNIFLNPPARVMKIKTKQKTNGTWLHLKAFAQLFFFLREHLFIYLLAVLGLRCCGEQGLLFVAVCGFLTAVASLVLERRL